jgi:hypothetical protein
MDTTQFSQWSDDDLVTTKEAAIYLGGISNPLSSSTLFYWRSKGCGPEFIRVGSSIRYRISSLKNFIKCGEK